MSDESKLTWEKDLDMPDIIHGTGKHWRYTIDTLDFTIRIYRDSYIMSEKSWAPDLDIAKQVCQIFEEWRNGQC
jgi:hypothetical protein